MYFPYADTYPSLRPDTQWEVDEAPLKNLYRQKVFTENQTEQPLV